jgi:hypothetical protein
VLTASSCRGLAHCGSLSSFSSSDVIVIIFILAVTFGLLRLRRRTRKPAKIKQED